MQENMEDHPEYGRSNEKFTSVAAGGQVHCGDYGAETELQRQLSTRHVTMIALGSSIGMGLWLGSGKSLVAGGPVGEFFRFWNSIERHILTTRFLRHHVGLLTLWNNGLGGCTLHRRAGCHVPFAFGFCSMDRQVRLPFGCFRSWMVLL